MTDNQQKDSKSNHVIKKRAKLNDDAKDKDSKAVNGTDKSNKVLESKESKRRIKKKRKKKTSLVIATKTIKIIHSCSLRRLSKQRLKIRLRKKRGKVAHQKKIYLRFYLKRLPKS